MNSAYNQGHDRVETVGKNIEVRAISIDSNHGEPLLSQQNAPVLTDAIPANSTRK